MIRILGCVDTLMKHDPSKIGVVGVPTIRSTWRIHRVGVPQIIQVMNDHFSIETYGSYCDLGCLQVLCSSLLLLLVITILLLLLLFFCDYYCHYYHSYILIINY